MFNIYIYTYVFADTYLYIYIFKSNRYVFNIYTYIYIYMYLQIHTYIYMYLQIHSYIFFRILICIYIRTSLTLSEKNNLYPWWGVCPISPCIPGIRMLIGHGRFAAEAQGATDMDDILAGVHRSKRETCKKHGSLDFDSYYFSCLNPWNRVGSKCTQKGWELLPYIFQPWNPVKGSIFRPNHVLHRQTLGDLIRLLNWEHGSKLLTSKSCSGGLRWRRRSLQIRTPKSLVLSYCWENQKVWSCFHKVNFLTLNDYPKLVSPCMFPQGLTFWH